MKMSRSILTVAGSLAIVTPVAAMAQSQPVTVTFTESGNEGQLPAPVIAGYLGDTQTSVSTEQSSVSLYNFFTQAPVAFSFTYNLLEPGSEDGDVSDQITFYGGGEQYGTTLNLLFNSDPAAFFSSFYGSAYETGSLMSIPLPRGDNGYTTNYTLSVSAESESGAVPEPATWALMLLGFGGIGMAMRRRGRASLAQVA